MSQQKTKSSLFSPNKQFLAQPNATSSSMSLQRSSSSSSTNVSNPAVGGGNSTNTNKPAPVVSGDMLRSCVKNAIDVLKVEKNIVKKFVEDLNDDVRVVNDASFKVQFDELVRLHLLKVKAREKNTRKRARMVEIEQAAIKNGEITAEELKERKKKKVSVPPPSPSLLVLERATIFACISTYINVELKNDSFKNYEIDDEIFDRVVNGYVGGLSNNCSSTMTTTSENDVNYAENPMMLLFFLTTLKPLLHEFISRQQKMINKVEDAVLLEDDVKKRAEEAQKIVKPPAYTRPEQLVALLQVLFDTSPKKKPNSFLIPLLSVFRQAFAAFLVKQDIINDDKHCESVFLEICASKVDDVVGRLEDKYKQDQVEGGLKRTNSNPLGLKDYGSDFKAMKIDFQEKVAKLLKPHFSQKWVKKMLHPDKCLLPEGKDLFQKFCATENKKK